MRKLRFLLLLTGFAIGGLLIGYPYLNETAYTMTANTAIQSFHEQVEAEQNAIGAEPDMDGAAPVIYPELLKAMRDYNLSLIESGQSDLSSPEAYEQSPINLADYGLESDSVIGTVYIPAIDLELPLYMGAGKGQMAKGAAVMGGTSLPIGGESTNAVIAGHRGFQGIPYFRNLDRLEIGDRVLVTNFWGTMTYAVTGIRIIEPDDIDAILIEDGKDKLTLLTCHPYTVGTQRMLIYCERINIP